MEKTCATCRFLSYELSLADPSCSRIGAGDKHWNDISWISRHNSTGGATLRVSKPDQFGCLLHEPKPPAPKIPDELWGVFDSYDGRFVAGTHAAGVYLTQPQAEAACESMAARNGCGKGTYFAARIK